MKKKQKEPELKEPDFRPGCLMIVGIIMVAIALIAFLLKFTPLP